MERDNNLSSWAEEIIRILAGLEQRIEQLEAQRHLLSQQPMIVQNMTVYRLDAEKVQFNLDEISVQELNGTLNIGINRNKLLEQSIATKQAALSPNRIPQDFPR